MPRRKTAKVKIDPNRKRGHIEEITKLTRYWMTIKLDNGISFSLSCNDGYVHLNFSGYDFDKPLQIQELNLMKVEHRLPNYLNIEYHVRKDT